MQKTISEIKRNNLIVLKKTNSYIFKKIQIQHSLDNSISHQTFS